MKFKPARALKINKKTKDTNAMNRAILTLLACLLAMHVFAQQQGHEKQETHLPMQIEECSSKGNCQMHSDSLTMDANWRWLHYSSGYQNCYEGNRWDSTYCPDGKTCA